MCEKSFRWRINELYRASGVSIQKFADKCGLSRQSMQYYLSGERMPDSAGLLKVCQACSVSADWLLGLSDVREPAAELRGVVEYTGLTEAAIKRITDKNDIGEFAAELSHLIEIPDFYGFIKEYKYYLTMLQRYDILEKDQFEENEDGKIVLSKYASVQFVKRRLEWHLTNITDEDYYKQDRIAGDNTMQQKFERRKKNIADLQAAIDSRKQESDEKETD